MTEIPRVDIAAHQLITTGIAARKWRLPGRGPNRAGPVCGKQMFAVTSELKSYLRTTPRSGGARMAAFAAPRDRLQRVRPTKPASASRCGRPHAIADGC